jgi:hypothetical protein
MHFTFRPLLLIRDIEVTTQQIEYKIKWNKINDILLS